MFQYRRALAQILIIVIMIIWVISGAGIGHSSVERMVNVNTEPANYVVTEEYPRCILSVISASGNRKIIYSYPNVSEIYGLAIDSYGNFIVCVPWRDKLSKVTPDGVMTVIYNFTKLTGPTGVAIDSLGNYIVTEYWADKLSKVTPAGVRKVIYNFTANTNPSNVAIDSSGNYIVTEAGPNMLSKVTPAGVRTVIYDFGARVEINNLWCVAIDSSGNYIVTEFNADKLSKVTPTGVRSVIYNFTKDTGPRGVTIDSQGNYIVTELLANVLSKITPAGERTVIYDWFQSLGLHERPAGVAILTVPKVGDLKVTVNDSTGTPIKGVAISSDSQPNGQTTLAGTSGDDGSVVFTRVLLGNYTLQAQKSDYVSMTGKVSVTAGGANELTMTLQSQPSEGIPGFPSVSVVVGVFLGSAFIWLYLRRPRLRGVRENVPA